jgi:long-chain fatty acid transport protein
VGRALATETELQSFYINPTVAYRIIPELSIGVGFDYAIANVTLKRKVQIPISQTAAVEGDLSMEGDGTGMGFNVGVQCELNDMIAVGASYRSKVKVDMDGTATFANLPSAVAPAFPGGDVSTTIPLPANYFIGVSVKPVPELELEVDYQGIVWSAYKELPMTFKTETAYQKSAVEPENYKDTYMIRFGAEYSISNVQIRAGYIYDHSPVEDPYLQPMLPDANRNDFTIGVGYGLTDAIQLDIAYMLVAFKDRTTTTNIHQFNGTYKSVASLFGLDLTYKF